MTSGWRPRFGGRGRERAWWLLAAAVLFAVLWAVAQALKWPGWALAVLGGLAAAAALVMPELRARFKQDDTRAALVEQAVAVPGGPARLPLVREAGLAQLRVHAAQVQVPYVERDVQHAVAKALGPGRAVLLVGHSMAGKTRLAAQVVHQRFPDAPLLVPESGKALRELVGEGLDPAGVVVWLDDLERFLGEDGLTFGLLARLTRDKAILVATIRSEAREGYRPRKDLRPPEWEVLEAFTQIDLKRRHTDTELKRIRAAVTDPAVLDAVQHYGLAEYLGAGPEALDKFTKGETTQPIGHALVRAAVDWRRTGLTRPIPNTVLTAPALVSVYLADRPDVPRTEAALDQGMDWATTKINETVALLGIVFPDPAGAPTFEAFDYLVDHLTLAGASIPDAMWQLALQEARPTEWKDLGYAAYRSSNLPVAELAIRRMAEGGEGGDTWVMYTLGLILRERGELAEAEGWYRRAADAGQREAMLNLGLLLHERGELAEVETWWRRAADAGESRAMFNLGLLLKQRGELAEAETWYRRAADAGHSGAMLNLGFLLAQRRELDKAEIWYRRAADTGDSGAMFNLGGLLHERGELAQAETWWRRAVDAGDVRAMYNLGLLLHKRGELAEVGTWWRRAMFHLGVLKQRGELAEAETWYRRAADAGQREAMLNLGLLLKQRGELAEAEIWYRRVADTGDSGAMLNLGLLLHDRGELAEAETWYRRAADTGHSGAMLNLGLLFEQQGDLGEAEGWYRRAADTGDSGAMLNLGLLLHERRELAEAETWYRRAADTGDIRAMYNLGGCLNSGGSSLRRKFGTGGWPNHDRTYTSGTVCVCWRS